MYQFGNIVTRFRVETRGVLRPRRVVRVEARSVQKYFYVFMIFLLPVKAPKVNVHRRISKRKSINFEDLSRFLISYGFSSVLA